MLRWLGTNTDVTRMRELQEQLETAYADLETKVAFRNLDLEHRVRELRRANRVRRLGCEQSGLPSGQAVFLQSATFPRRTEFCSQLPTPFWL